MHLFLATVSTSNFDFVALDETPEAATRTPMRGWHSHCANTDADITYVRPGDVRVIEIAAGQCLRDGSRVYPR